MNANALLKLVPTKVVKERIVTLEGLQAECLTQIKDAWDSGKTIDTRGVRRTYRGYQEEVTQLQAHLKAQSETPTE